MMDDLISVIIFEVYSPVVLDWIQSIDDYIVVISISLTDM